MEDRAFDTLLLPVQNGNELWIHADEEFLYLVRPPIMRVRCDLIRRNRKTKQDEILRNCRCLTDARQQLEMILDIKL